MTDVPAAPDRDPERLVRAYADLVLRVCYTYLRSTADAEDVCQDTLIKLVCREEPFRDLDHERAWVVRVASNACKNLLRDRGAHPEVNLDEVPEPPSGDAVDERALGRVPALLRGLWGPRHFRAGGRERERRPPAPEPREGAAQGDPEGRLR